MKKALLIGLATSALALAGSIASIRYSAPVAHADDPVKVTAGSKIYLDLGTTSWGDAGAKILFWNTNANGGSGEFYEFEKDNPSDPYCYITLDADCTKFDLVRGPSVSWDGKYNQSADSYFSEYCNLIRATGYDLENKMTFTWGAYEKGYSDASVNSDAFYGWAQRDYYTYYVYVWETFEVDGITLRNEPNGSWPGTAAEVTSKTVYNPGNKSSQTGTYGIVKFNYNYRNLSNTHVKIYFDAGGWNKESKTIVASPEDGEVQLTPGAYYLNANDYDLWELSIDANMGYDASLAFKLDKADICSLSEIDADDLRDEMDGNKGFITGATWDGYNYNAAYNLVDSQCTSPKNSAKAIAGVVSNNSGNEYPAIAVVLAGFVLLSGGLFLLRKRKAE